MNLERIRKLIPYKTAAMGVHYRIGQICMPRFANFQKQK